MKKQDIKSLSPAAKRELVIEIAADYTKEDISYMSKNSNYSAEKALNQIAMHHIASQAIARVFKQRVEKLLK